MAKKLQTKISFSSDRLWEHKLSQVYHLLVPPNDLSFATGYEHKLIEQPVYEDSSNIYEGILRPAKGE